MIASELADNELYTKLDISRNQLDPEDCKNIAMALKSNNRLTDLNLEDNWLCGLQFGGTGTYDSSGIQALANALENNEVLTSLNISWNMLGCDGGYMLAKALTVNTMLTSLDLSWNHLCDSDVVDATKVQGESEVGATVVYEERKMTVREVIKRKYPYEEPSLWLVDMSGVIELSESLKVNKRLKELNLSNNALGPEGGKAIAEALAGNAVLTTLNLARNYLCGLDEKQGADSQLDSTSYDPSGIIALAEALAGNAGLTELNVELNYIGPEGGKAIADALTKNKVLTNLNLANNDLSRKDDATGIQSLADALKSNQVLKSLNLFSNAIGIVGANAIAKALADNAVLAKLDFRFNNIGDEGENVFSDVRNGLNLIL